MSDGARIVAGVLCLVVLVGAPIPVWGQSTPQAGIGDVSISGNGVIDATETSNGSTYLWQDEPVNVSVTFADFPNARNYRVCLGDEREGAPTAELACGLTALPNGTNGTTEFSNVTWPGNATGGQGLVVELQKLSNESNATVLDRKTIPVTVLRKQGDFDSDGLTNTREVEEGYNLSNFDMDSDGLPDGAEVNQYDTEPQNADSDGDGIPDGVEIQGTTSASAADTDGDGLGDSAESTLRTDPTNPWTPVWLAAFVLLIIGVVVFGAIRLRRRWRGRFGGPASAPDDGGGADGTGNATDETPEATANADPAPEPLTDEDRVLALLRDHGGRMKQSKIVDETEWSKAKVSRLLSTMNDEETINKLSIGRENIISLDGHGPEAAQSPREENASD
jgi:hypothetical protein